MNLAEDDCAVKIAVRERPLREIYENNEVTSAISYHSSNSNILIADERPFAFDHVLPKNVSQKGLFDFLVMPLVSKVLEGFNCTALAYGQTGTGKSFTMGLNPESFEGEDMGVIPRCLQEILKQKSDGPDFKYEIHGSFIEIYSEKVYDLLSENSAEPIIARGYKFTGGTRKRIENINDAYALLTQGTKNRHVRPTKMNAQSSRSHAIFTIYVQNIARNKITQSCLNLVDLAGSEGVRRTGHQGVALSEGVHINQGLLSIGKVLQAITHGYKVIPYRDSVLSSVLQDSLNPNSYFTLLACISPHREDLSETLSTLRFAQSAKNLKHNPQINLKLMELKKSKTPFKANQYSGKKSLATPTPYKRPFSLVNSKQSIGPKKSTYHANTFCTPNKKEKGRENSKFNQTVVGLTPKEKQKIGSVRMPVSKVAPFSIGPSEQDSRLYRYNDTSLESRPSLMSLNMSTSTAIESNPTTSGKTFSPIVRRCMAEMESTMKSSMLRVLESIKHTNTAAITTQNLSPNALAERKLRDIIRQELLTIRRQNNVDDHRVADSGVRCELFRSSSPIFKVPEIPGVRPMSDFYTSQMSISSQNESFIKDDATILPKSLRRSMRHSSKTNSFCTEDSMVMPSRRSSRLSSITEIHKNKRRSIRVAARKEMPQQEEKPTTKSKKRTKATKANVLVNNSIIAGYFDEEKERKTPKTALANHQKAILQMLNNASMKELQLLPQIGLKTAFQIVTQRTLHGKFKNFTQIGKLPIWRGQAWERFKAANNITS